MSEVLTESEISRNRLSDYLIELALNPIAVDRLRDDADAALAGANLSPEEKSILASGDAAMLAQAFDGAGPISSLPVVVVIVVNVGCN